MNDRNPSAQTHYNPMLNPQHEVAPVDVLCSKRGRVRITGYRKKIQYPTAITKCSTRGISSYGSRNRPGAPV